MAVINIDTRLFAQVDQNELWLLIHIVKRLNEKMFCWPSNKTLLKDTGWGMEKLQSVKKSLCIKKIIYVQSRYFEDSRASNFYHLNTRFIGVYVDGERLSKAATGKSGDPTGKSDIADRKDQQAPLPGEPADIEVLDTNEVLPVDSDESTEQGSLFGTHDQNKPVKKAAHPAFAGCVDHWLKVVHPDWKFRTVDGKMINQIIGHIEHRLNKREDIHELLKENDISKLIVDSFAHFCKSLPEFYQTQTLTVLSSKFDSIMDQIRNGKKQFTSKTSASGTIAAL